MTGPMSPDDQGNDLGARDRARVDYLSAPRDATAPVWTDLDDEDRTELDELHRLLADENLWAEPPAELQDSIVAAIAAEADAPDSVAGFAPGPVDLAAARDRRLAQGSAGARSSHRRASGGRRWARPAILIAAAAAVGAVALTAVVLLRTASPAPTFTASLTATELAPGAGGTVTMVREESGWEIVLNAFGLPRLDGGEFYQAWMRNEEGTLVAVGSFNEGMDVVLWGGVSPRTYPTFSITRESADGDQASSGQRVLVGTAVEVPG
jgi:hypothetical protein